MKCVAQRRLGWLRPQLLLPVREQRQPEPGWVLALQPLPSCKRAEATEPWPEQEPAQQQVEAPVVQPVQLQRPEEEQVEQPASAEQQPLPRRLAAGLQEPLVPEEQQEQQPPQQALVCIQPEGSPEQKPTHSLASEAPLWAALAGLPPKPNWPHTRTSRSTQGCPTRDSAI